MEKTKNRIVAVRHNALNDAGRLLLAQLLVKAGYSVRIGTDKTGNNRSVYYVEYWIE